LKGGAARCDSTTVNLPLRKVKSTTSMVRIGRSKPGSVEEVAVM
jgi:hypothetical protein